MKRSAREAATPAIFKQGRAFVSRFLQLPAPPANLPHVRGKLEDVADDDPLLFKHQIPFFSMSPRHFPKPLFLVQTVHFGDAIAATLNLNLQWSALGIFKAADPS